MENNKNVIDPLFAEVELFAKRQFELMKLQLLDKFAHFIAQFITGFLFIMVIALSCIFFSNTIAIWLGKLLGEIYYGYLIVAIAYGIVAIGVWLYYAPIKSKLNNWVVRRIFS